MWTGAVANVVLGLLTSCLSGSAVWLWQQGRRTRRLRLKSRVVGARPGETCLIVMNNKAGAPGSAHHSDVQAMIEVAVLVHELRCQVVVTRSDDFHGSNEDRVEFCIGGPASNARAVGHLAHSLPGITFRPYTDPDHPLSIEVGGERYPWVRGDSGYALVARFMAPGSVRPVVLICGQSAVTNHAAAYWLRRSCAEVATTVTSTERFCLLLRVHDIATYGHQGVQLHRDVTWAAFG